MVMKYRSPCSALQLSSTYRTNTSLREEPILLDPALLLHLRCHALT